MRIPHWIESKWSQPTKVPAMADLFCSRHYQKSCCPPA
jgi:hypothetical protein